VILLPVSNEDRKINPSRCHVTSRCTDGFGVQNDQPILAQLRFSIRHTQCGFSTRLHVHGNHNRLGLSDMAGMPATGNHDQRTRDPLRDL
jgi:hypothetical protein